MQNDRFWHDAAKAGEKPWVRRAGVIQTSTGSAMTRSSSSSMQLAFDHTSASSLSDFSHRRCSSIHLMPVRLMLAKQHPLSLPARLPIGPSAFSYGRIQQRFRAPMWAGGKSTSAFESERPYSAGTASAQVRIVPGAVVASLENLLATSNRCRHSIRPQGRHPPRPDESVQRAHSRTRWASFDNSESDLGGRERHVIGNYRPGETLESERADLFGHNTSF